MASAGAHPDDSEVLTFRIADEHYALAVDAITEIIRPRHITRVPLAPANLLGVANLRGTILPIISLAGLLGREAGGLGPASRAVVVDQGAPLGLLVDEVFAVAPGADAKRIDLEALLARDFSGLRVGSASHDAARRESDREDRPGPTDTLRNTLALVAFTVARQEYALPLDSVVEVTALAASIAAVPDTDQAMIGVTEFRDGLLPLVSLRVLLGLPTDGFDRHHARVVVTRLGAALVGLVVDGMNAILRVPDDLIGPVPAILMRGAGEARIEAICRLDGGRRLVSILSSATLFDRTTAARVLAEAKEGATQMAGSTNEGGAVEQFVVFTLGDEFYGLPIAAVEEVIRRPDTLTRVPRAPAFVEGVMNLRGKVVPVIDQRQRFGSPGTSGRNRRILIMTIGNLQTGFVVDSVSEILSAAAREVTPAPALSATGVQLFDRVARVERDGRMILLIDPGALLDRTERDILTAITLTTIAGGTEAVPAS